jgi:hypothetical protein
MFRIGRIRPNCHCGRFSDFEPVSLPGPFIPPIADMRRLCRHVGFVPEPEVGDRNFSSLTAHRFVQCRSSICLKFIKVAPRQLLFKTVNI